MTPRMSACQALIFDVATSVQPRISAVARELRLMICIDGGRSAVVVGASVVVGAAVVVGASVVVGAAVVVGAVVCQTRT